MAEYVEREYPMGERVGNVLVHIADKCALRAHRRGGVGRGKGMKERADKQTVRRSSGRWTEAGFSMTNRTLKRWL